MSTLEFKVQSDRVQSNDEAAGVADAVAWIAVKVSAGFDRPPSAPGMDDVSALIPWRWEPIASDTAGPLWNPHDASSWAIWTIEEASGKITAVDSARVTVISRDITRAGLHPALDQAVAGIAFDADGNVRAASLSFDPPDTETDLAGTVPGFVERLATLPDPLPRASRVHALLAIEPSVEDNFETVRFIAAPRLRFSTGSFDPLGGMPAPIANVNGHKLEAWQVDNAGCCVQMVASLKKEDMKASPADGRVIDLFEQTIDVDGGETAYLRTLPTAEAVAELPQKLADAMDPIARIRSVLERATTVWLTPLDDSPEQQIIANARKEALRADFETGNATPPPLRLKRALDIAAIQVLGQRFDMVGRFEVPLIDALTTDRGKAAQILLKAHLAALPWLADDEDVPAMRISESDITALHDDDGNNFTLDEASPFSVVFLRAALGLAGTGTGVEPVAETEILRRLWSSKGPVPAAQPNRRQGLRYFEFGDQDVAKGELRLRLQWREPPAYEDPTDPGGDASVFSAVSFEHARASASLAYGAPFIEGIVSGRSNWYQAPVTAAADTPLFERLKTAMQALLWSEPATPGLYRSLLAQMPPVAADDVLPSLLEAILTMASTEAAVIAGRLAFRADPFDRITPLPLPMALQVDQLRTFPRETDAWTRLAGYGLLVARTGYTAEDGSVNPTHASPYVSLNPATLYIGGLSEEPDPVAKAGMAKGLLISGAFADGTERDFVDPWPYSPGDGIGISDAVAEFTNSWATAPMPGHAVVDQPGTIQGVAAARIVAGPPPRPGSSPKAPPRRLPAFSFGRRYEVLGHLVAQGGVLAPFLRHPDNPYVFAETLDPGSRARATLENYMRTTGLGAPTIAHDLPPLPIEITLIANELPKRLAPSRLSRGGLRINYDQDTGGTLIDWPGGRDPGLRFEFIVTNAGSAVSMFTANLADEAGDYWTFDLTVEPSRSAGERWWRVDVTPAGDLRARYQDLPQLAEEHLRRDFDDDTRWITHDVEPASRDRLPTGKEGAYLRITGTDHELTIEPFRVVPLSNTMDLPKLSEVPGVSATRRARANASDPILLDGFDVLPHGPKKNSNHIIRASLNAIITGPGTDRHTWERWTNCALYSLPAGNLVRDTVFKTLVSLQAKPAPTDDNDAREEMPDPAVTALWAELWETFPRRARIGKPICFTAAFPSRPEITARMRAGDTASVTSSDGRVLIAFLQPGRVYELRVRAAVEADAKLFDGTRENSLRFGSAVIESCTVEIDETMKKWLLGQTSVLTVEVATHELPEAKVIQQVLQPSKAPSGRGIDLVLPPIFGAETRRILRYCKEAGLVPQRWSWRGTPRPFQAADAFDGRADTDIGRIEFGSLRAAHVLGAAGVPATDPARLPVVATRDLDWRGGWNLWRFKLRLTSRYAPLFAKEESSRVTFDGGEGWLRHDEKDADNGRSVTRPPPALVVPLTEADDDGKSSVPPLLALFYGPMHINDHFGDVISAAAEIARHPAPDFTAAADTADGEPYPRNRLKFLVEAGSDPARTGDGHSGVAIPLKIEGPIGYSFDRDRNAGRFNNSGFLVTPASATLAPWSMIKLKFRREEDPDGLDHLIPYSPGAPIVIAGVVQGASGGRTIRHEGIVLDFPRLRAGGTVELALDEPPALPKPDGTMPKGGQRIKLKVDLSGPKLSIAAWILKVSDQDEHNSDWAAPTGEPNAGWVSLNLPPNGWFSLRLVVSTNSKPAEQQSWRPSGIVAVQARVNLDETKEAWQSLFSLPMETLSETIPIGESARVALASGLGDALLVKPIRLSGYSASLWCQFTVPSSHFFVTDGGPSRNIAVDKVRLAAVNGGAKWSDIVLTGLEGQRLKLLSDTPATSANETDRAQSAVTELMFAVLTEPTFDSLGRRSERPLAIVPLVDGAAGTQCGAPIWPLLANPTEARPPTQDEGPGRFRIMRVLVRKGTVLDRFDDLFDEPLRPENGTEPSLPGDAKALVLSISRPSNWSF